MFAEKSSYHPPNLQLPPIGKRFQRRARPPPSPSPSSTSTKATHIAENVSALKAKYADYTTWLKTSTLPNREPVLTQELLKNSLCQMGIDTAKAERLVSTCSWYVYQFQKDLKNEGEEKDPIISIKQQQHRKKSNKPRMMKDSPEDSTSSISSHEKADSVSSTRLPPIRSNHSILPTIHVSDLSTSSRLRRVDFDNERVKTLPPPSSQPPLNRTRVLPKLSRESSNNPPPPLPSVDLESSSSSRTLRRHGPVVGQTRSILRKPLSPSSPSVTSVELNQQKTRSRLLTPSSTILDTVPLGTRSQRLFGGSECFAQIMNELEQQKHKPTNIVN